ncbi:Histidinol-phosphate aminotransferase [compost metagenome]|jgi:histidinol-phosphate aminotransferase|uniref:Histidinol-phosphate aminotransferase n=3 Tax=Sphingobacterium TaxID=28453 RepID=A0ABX7CNJ9_SPHMU|nr:MULTISPECIES: histidinol-phosphate transaminase [Sphingobacterium]MCS4166729.1 histidinol-phosphate aminotransferase [Sphingobacterium sp. BIGb0116]QMV69340.1 histidinol-phosphate transaminase [Sphingobacterium paramultivorum]QQT31335.1 histidinol-phosphate transaminase [Sphingobacterium multivorum]QQT52733.1 histidinol-phosphate transaminase [Sphingobacterium multivorum]QRY57845.1 histidinol-phosphate transaminase [Sphingobacterium siyangense]
MDNPFNLNNLLRENIKKLVPYSSARDEFKGEASILIDANENPFGSPLNHDYNRYPDPLQHQVKAKLSKIKGVPSENIFLGNGSDEAIDILYRAFCTPGVDNVILVPPTYGMYEVSANINDVAFKKVNLTADYQLDLDGIANAIDAHTKLIFICSPNNPTGNSIRRQDIETILNNFQGLVVVDEAYINFSAVKSFTQELAEYPNLVVLQTLSKAWGLAALRLGMAFASKEIIAVYNKIKPPYNINQATQDIVLEALDQVDQVNDWIKETVAEREKLVRELLELDYVQHITPSDANFILVKMEQPREVYDYLVQYGIIVRDRSKVELCEGCLRITVGTPAENQILLEKLNQINK